MLITLAALPKLECTVNHLLPISIYEDFIAFPYTMSELSAQFVKRGYWVNVSQGRILGQTLTTDIQTGSIIVALLAVCTTIGLSHFWHLIAFLFYQIRADGRPTEGLIRQQQVLLRTLPTASSYATDSIKLIYTWNPISSKKVLGQSIAQIFLAFLFTLGSLAAGIFASYAVSGSDLEVLVQSPYCGFFKSQDLEVLNEFIVTYSTQVMDTGALYARECYQGGRNPPARCNIFIRPTVNFTTEEVPCPFQGHCISSGVAFDTGMIDVTTQYGLNMASTSGGGIKHRIRRTCGVLSTENRTSIANASDLPTHFLGSPPKPGQQLLLVHLGTREGEAPGSALANVTVAIDVLRTKDLWTR